MNVLDKVYIAAAFDFLHVIYIGEYVSKKENRRPAWRCGIFISSKSYNYISYLKQILRDYRRLEEKFTVIGKENTRKSYYYRITLTGLQIDRFLDIVSDVTLRLQKQIYLIKNFRATIKPGRDTLTLETLKKRHFIEQELKKSYPKNDLFPSHYSNDMKLSYLASLIDLTARLVIYCPFNNCRGSWIVAMGITCSDSWIIELFESEVGSSQRFTRRGAFGKNNMKSFYWILRNQKLYEFSKKITPFLKVKHEKMSMITEILETFDSEFPARKGEVKHIRHSIKNRFYNSVSSKCDCLDEIQG